MNTTNLLIVAGITILGVGGYLWWQRQQRMRLLAPQTARQLAATQAFGRNLTITNLRPVASTRPLVISERIG